MKKIIALVLAVMLVGICCVASADKLAEIKEKGKLSAVKKVAFEGCKDMGIALSREDVKMVEQLIEQTGQFVVLKKNYISKWETFANQLKNSGYSEEAVKAMLESMEFGNLKL